MNDIESRFRRYIFPVASYSLISVAMDEGEADSGIEVNAGVGGADRPVDVAVRRSTRGKNRDAASTTDSTSASNGPRLDDAAGENDANDDAGATVAVKSGVEEDPGAVFIRVFIHDQNLQRCYKFHLDEVVFNAKKKASKADVDITKNCNLLRHLNHYPLFESRCCPRW